MKEPEFDDKEYVKNELKDRSTLQGNQRALPSIETNPYVLPKTRDCVILSTCVILLFLAGTTVFGFYPLLLQSTNFPYLQEVSNNWNQGIIVDIHLNYTCPTNYTPIYQYVYQGTRPGCNCNGTIIAKPCTQKAKVNKCQDVPHFSATPLSAFIPDDPTWANYNTGLQICIKRDFNNTYANRASISPYTCPSGMMPCGNVSNFQNRLCVSESVGACPITYIAAQAVPLAEFLLCSNCIALSYDPVSSNMTTLFYSSTYDGPPIAEFRLNEYAMCEFNTTDNIDPLRVEYALNAEQRTFCNATTTWNQTWSQILSVNESALWAFNNLMPNVMNDMPDYNLTGAANYRYNLYTRPYISWTVGCRGSMSTFLSTLNMATVTNPVQLAVLATALPFAAILGLVEIILEIIRLCGYRACTNVDVVMYERRLRIINIAVGAVIAVIFGIGIAIMSQITSWYSNLADAGCFAQATTTQAQNDLQNYVNTLNTIIDMDIGGLVLAVLFIGYQLFEHSILKARAAKYQVIPRIKMDKTDTDLTKSEIIQDMKVSDLTSFHNFEQTNPNNYGNQANLENTTTSYQFNAINMGNNSNILIADDGGSFMPINQTNNDAENSMYNTHQGNYQGYDALNQSQLDYTQNQINLGHADGNNIDISYADDAMNNQTPDQDHVPVRNFTLENRIRY